jgi:Flp pilus assembly protein TadG
MTRHRTQSEQGSVTILVLSVCAMMLFVGGVAFDLWRAFSERRALAGVVDAAAVAGASGIDTDLYRTTGEVRLDRTTSEALAWDNLRHQEDTRSLVDATVDATTNDVTVTAIGRVDFTLLRIFLSGEEPFRVTIRATAEPRRSS